MRFLFSDVSNDAHVEADEGADGDFLMPSDVYAEAVLALVKVAEAAHGLRMEYESCPEPVPVEIACGIDPLLETLTAFDFRGDA